MSDEKNVVVVDIKMPFISMVMFMVKWVIASIPAFIILSIIGSIIMALLGSMMNSMVLMPPVVGCKCQATKNCSCYPVGFITSEKGSMSTIVEYYKNTHQETRSENRKPKGYPVRYIK